MFELVAPDELNGSLFTCLLPLRGPRVGVKAVTDAEGGSDSNPFLAARARSVATAWAEEETAKFWAWPEAVLVSATSIPISDRRVVFGRSTATLAEESDTDQPVTLPETRAASLWHSPGFGFVLALENLVVGTHVANEADHLGTLLTEAQIEDDLRGTSDSGIETLLKRMWGDSDITLEGIFGEKVAELDPDFTQRRLNELLIFRRTAISGGRQVEGIVTGLSAATEDLGISDLLLRATVGEDVEFDDLDARQGQYHWAYNSISVAGEPARSSAVCALRSDGRVAVLDQDAFSIYHDYLGVGGDATISALIPVASILGQKARDFWDVAQAIQGFAWEADENLQPDEIIEKLDDGLHVARTVRARLELRRLLAEQLFNESNFESWTNAPHLRRQLARTALLDVVMVTDKAPADGTSELSVSLSVLERLLEKQLVAERRHQEKARDEASSKTRTVVQTALGVITGAGLLGVFAALASVPRTNREIPSLASAGLWTLLASTVLGLLTAAGWTLLQRHNDAREEMRSRTLVMWAGVACLMAVAGLLAPTPMNLVLLAGGLITVATAVALALWKLHPSN